MTHKNMTDFEEQSPGRRLSMLHRLSMAYLAEPLGKLNIARGKIGFLMGVLRREGIIQEDLTRALCIDRAATARALFDLEHDGLIRREEDAQDRRRKRVYPTDKARALQDSLVALLSAHNDTLFAGFSRQERTLCLDMLDRLIANLRAATEAVKA